MAALKEERMEGAPILSEEVPLEFPENLQAFRTAAAVGEYSVYRLFLKEGYLFNKY